jgi:hypothetical protein
MTFKSTRREAQARKRRYTPTTSRAFLLDLDRLAVKRLAEKSRRRVANLPHDPEFCAECAAAQYR